MTQPAWVHPTCHLHAAAIMLPLFPIGMPMHPQSTGEHRTAPHYWGALYCTTAQHCSMYCTTVQHHSTVLHFSTPVYEYTASWPWPVRALSCHECGPGLARVRPGPPRLSDLVAHLEDTLRQLCMHGVVASHLDLLRDLASCE